MNDHLRSGKSSGSTNDDDVNVDEDADAAKKVVGVVKAVGCPSAGNEVAK